MAMRRKCRFRGDIFLIRMKAVSGQATTFPDPAMILFAKPIDERSLGSSRPKKTSFRSILQ
jgi:hypothetical protein